MKVLFTGYAPVHFLCFRPLFRKLNALPEFDVHVSGGFRTFNDADEALYDGPGMYLPLGVPADRILTAEQMQAMDFDLLFAANTKLVEPRHVGSRIQIFHGISFRNRSIRAANMHCDSYFLAGPYMRRKFVEAGLLSEDDERGLSIGFMKTDALVDGSLDRSAILAENGVDGSRPVLLYAPTGQAHNSLETMGEDVLRRLSATGRYDIMVKLHDHPKDDTTNWAARIEAIGNERVHLVSDLDVIPQLFAADLLITDASSVSSEYSLLDRPMVFLDVPELIDDSRRKSGSMVDTETWAQHDGDLVKRPEDVVKAVDDALADPQRHSATRRAMSRDLFYNPGRATLSALAWLREKFGASP